jgi:hypothetical protein
MQNKRNIVLTVIFISGACRLSAQNPVDSLFGSQTPLNIGLSISYRDIRQSKKDSTYIDHILYYQNTFGKPDSIKVSLKGRGNFRLKECYFPPLWIKIKKSESKGTLFEGYKKLKLVLPCNSAGSGSSLILKEFLCYKLYEEITVYSFHTRLANIDLTELKGKKSTKSNPKGIFIEDMDNTASRLHAKALANVAIASKALNDTGAARFELFQYMISNTDWSVVHQHNSKLIVLNANKYISIPYDFDMSGLVNAPYAVVSQINGEQLDAKYVTDRVYRGYCHSSGVMQFVRQEFIAKKGKLLSVPDQLAGNLSDKDIKKAKNYLEDFFSILEDDRLFERNILDKCRAH